MWSCQYIFSTKCKILENVNKYEYVIFLPYMISVSRFGIHHAWLHGECRISLYIRQKLHIQAAAVPKKFTYIPSLCDIHYAIVTAGSFLRQLLALHVQNGYIITHTITIIMCQRITIVKPLLKQLACSKIILNTIQWLQKAEHVQKYIK